MARWKTMVWTRLGWLGMLLLVGVACSTFRDHDEKQVADAEVGEVATEEVSEEVDAPVDVRDAEEEVEDKTKRPDVADMDADAAVETTGPACEPGWEGEDCTQAICEPGCANGGHCVAPGQCACESGWVGVRCTDAVCAPACAAGFRCEGPNVCCPLGWLGADCSVPDRVRIPAAGDSLTFTMGCAGRYDDCWPAEKPAREVTLSAYAMDRFPVTVAAFERCVAAGRCYEPENEAETTYHGEGMAAYPVNYVTWANARQYCAWAHGRLPTEAEWERAAKGTGTPTFPWGDACPALADDTFCGESAWDGATARANCYDCGGGFDGPAPADAFPRGQSSEGLWDLAGNLEEWVSDYYDPDYYGYAGTTLNPGGPSVSTLSKATRGGHWASSLMDLRVSARGNQPPLAWNSVGFRCVQSVVVTP